MHSVVSIVPFEALNPGSEPTTSLFKLLEAASGLVASPPSAIHLPSSSSSFIPRLLQQRVPNRRVQLLALPDIQYDAAAGPNNAPARSALYNAAVLQQLALLLLLLVSDTVLLLVPTEAVPAGLLQLLHLLAAVHSALLQQQQSADATIGGAAGDASSSKLLQLLRLRQQPAQLHIALQVPAHAAAEPDRWPEAAAAAVQQAENTLIRCKAAMASPLLQQQQQGASAGRSHAVSSHRRTLLFELAGVHCCCKGAGPDTVPAKRAAILGAIQQQVLAFDRHSAAPMPAAGPTNSTRQQQQQALHTGTALDTIQAATAAAAPAAALPGLSQLLGHVVAAVAVAAEEADKPTMHQGPVPFTQLHLQQLWQDLLSLMFTGKSSSSCELEQTHQHSSSQPALELACHDLSQYDIIGPDDIIGDEDESSASEDSWDEADDGWEEVQQQDDDQAQQERQQQQLPGHLLAAAVDPLYVVSVKICRRAAREGLKAYMQAISPQRYTAAVHQAAVGQALQAYAAAATGPAMPDLQQLLVAACQQVWADGRQQCSQLSMTGRACTLSPHDRSVQSHDSGTRLQVFSPDGSTVTEMGDWFDLEAANVLPAQQLLQQHVSRQQAQSKPQQQLDRTQQQGAKQALGHLLMVALQLSRYTAPPGNSTASAHSVLQSVVQHVPSSSGGALHTSTPEQQVVQLNPRAPGPQQSQALNPVVQETAGFRVLLGPWMSLWHTGLGEGVHDPEAGVLGPGWAPGFSKLQELRVLAPPTKPLAVVTAPPPAADGKQKQQTHKKPDLASQLRRKGGRGSGAASKTPEPVLGPEDFPTLQQALGAKKHTSAAAVQQQVAAAAAEGSGRGRRSGNKQQQQQQVVDDPTPKDQAAAAKAAQEQEQQEQVWSAWQKLSCAAIDHPAARENTLTHAARAEAAEAAAAGAAGGRGGGRGTRGGRAAAAAAGGRGRHLGRETAAAQPAEVAAVVLAKLWIGLEYANLEGTRVLLTPQQLPSGVLQRRQQPQQQQQQQQQQAGDVTFAAATAAGGPAAVGKDQPQETRPRRQGKQQQQQQQISRHGPAASPVLKHSAGPAAAQAAAAAAAVGSSGSSLQGPAVHFLQQDLPLHITPEQLQLRKDSDGAPAAASSSAGSCTPTRLSLLQLQRIYVRTPPAPFRFAVKPQVAFTWSQQQHTAAGGPSSSQHGAPDSAGPAAAAAAAAAVVPKVPSDRGAAGAVEDLASSPELLDTPNRLLFSSEQVQDLPADSLVVLTLPQVYAAPCSWVQAVAGPAAAAAVASAGATVGKLDPGGEGSKQCATASMATAVPAETEPASVGVEAIAATDTAAVMGGAQCSRASTAEETASSSSVTADVLLPLIPVAPAVHSSRANGPKEPLPEAAVWQGVLVAGSWLFPAVKQPHTAAAAASSTTMV